MAIARELNQDGVPTSYTAKGESWSSWRPATIRNLIRDPAYKGEAYAFRWARRGSTKPPEEWQKMPDGLFHPIVTVEEWDRAQERLSANRGERARNEKLPALLRGLIYCARCGLRLYPIRENRIKSGEKVAYNYYRCSSRVLRQLRSDADPACRARYAAAEIIEGEVWGELLKMIADSEKILRLLEVSSNTGAAERFETRRASVLKALARKDAEQRRQVRNLRAIDDHQTVQLIRNDLLEIESERKKLQAESAEVEEMIRARELSKLGDEQLTASKLRASLDRFGFDEKRLALEALGARIEADGNAWRLRLTDWEEIATDGTARRPRESFGGEVTITRVNRFEDLPFGQRSTWRRLAERWVAFFGARQSVEPQNATGLESVQALAKPHINHRRSDR